MVNGYRVLILSNVSDGGSNPYTVELIKALSDVSLCSHVDYGAFWLDYEAGHWDFVIVQWPEQLVPQNDFDALKLFESKLSALALRSKVVTVVHNLLPHYRKGEFDGLLYAAVFNISHGFIHLGNASVEALHGLFPNTASKPYVVVPHGNYECFGHKVDQALARKYIGLREKGLVVLVFGELRAVEEFDLALGAVHAGLSADSTLLVVGRVPLRARGGNYGRVLSYFMAAMRAFYFYIRTVCNSKVVLHEKRVPASEVAKYVCASDIILIARKESLNSGNVALGFTYGKVVVGPRIGNIGEVLESSGNPVYDPLSQHSLKKAMLQACRLVSTDLGSFNEELAINSWRWDLVGKRIVDFLVDISKD